MRALVVLLFSLLSKAEFCARVIVVRERMETKEQEINGVWMTEEKLKKSGDFSPCFG